MHSERFRFDRPVPLNGYRWWYLDGLDGAGEFGVTLIAFIGSVFSPYYARARRRGAADPEEHCAMNIALYGPGMHHWSMTERGREQLFRTARSISIAASRMQWIGDELSITIDERCAPLPRRLRGNITLTPKAWQEREFWLDETRAHGWCPLAPCARIEVDFEQPKLRWSGLGYLDSNWGAAPLEATFRAWHWSRMTSAEEALIHYDIEARAAGHCELALRFGADGSSEVLEPASQLTLPPSRWRISRSLRCRDPGEMRLLKTLEDGPFYCRSLLRDQTRPATPMHTLHESLDLNRFGQPWVQSILPFRMPRLARRAP